jgi:hypothetical protein
MRRLLATERGTELYRRRQPMIETAFGHTKHNARDGPLQTTRPRRRARRMALDHRHHNLL